MSLVDDLMCGAIDTHLHFGPEMCAERRLDALGVATSARNLGMRAVVLKSREYPTTPVAKLVGQIVPEIQVFGSVTLDDEIGGLNPKAVEIGGTIGAKIVWMPTFSAANFIRARGGEGEGITILDKDRNIIPQVGQILDTIKKHDMVLGTGHLSTEEVFALAREARRRGISKVVVTHPYHHGSSNVTLAEQKELASLGVLIELTCVVLMPGASTGVTLDQMIESVEAVGAENCIMSTDLGQGINPPPAEGLRMFIAHLLRRGISPEQIEVMVKKNPARLLGLD